MPRLILLVALVFIVWYFIQRIKALQKKPEKERKAALWRLIFIGLFGVTLALVLSGRAHWLAAALAGLFPLLKGSAGLLMRALPMLQAWLRRGGGSKFGPTLRSESLEIKVNIGNGSIDGKILKGELAGQSLSSLSREQLDPLLAQWRSDDPKAARLLNAYLARRFHNTGNDHYQQHSQPETATEKGEAWQILGLEEGASKEEVIKAHKRLIQKLHPDRGGNDYLAAKINAAKDTLIGKT
jgi:hypothetical protein